MNVALIVFAGVGSRINSKIPKQFIKIKDKELVSYTIDVFNNSPLIDEIILVTHPDYVDYVNEMVKKYSYNKVKRVISGSSTRQKSVEKGLIFTNYDDNDKILIHDGDRPLVDNKIIESNINALDEYDAVCTFIKHKDALPNVSNSGRKIVLAGDDVDVQTPQSFRYGLIKKYHVLKRDQEFNDDIGIVEGEIQFIAYVKGDKKNFKVTTDIDLETFKNMI